MPAWMTSLLRDDVSVPIPSAASRMMTFTPRQRQRLSHREPDNPGPHHDAIGSCCTAGHPTRTTGTPWCCRSPRWLLRAHTVAARLRADPLRCIASTPRSGQQARARTPTCCDVHAGAGASTPADAGRLRLGRPRQPASSPRMAAAAGARPGLDHRLQHPDHRRREPALAAAGAGVAAAGHQRHFDTERGRAGLAAEPPRALPPALAHCGRPTGRFDDATYRPPPPTASTTSDFGRAS